MILRCLAQVTEAEAPPNSTLPRWRTSTMASTVAIQTHQIEFAGLAAQIARENLESSHLQVLCRQFLGGHAALHAHIVHAPSCDRADYLAADISGAFAQIMVW